MNRVLLNILIGLTLGLSVSASIVEREPVFMMGGIFASGLFFAIHAMDKMIETPRRSGE